MKRFLLCLVLAAGVSVLVWTQSSSDQGLSALEQAVASSVSNAIGQDTDAGVAIAVIKDGKLFYSAGFGLRDRDPSEKVDAQTVFPIGSSTKPFTSMAVAMLVQEGKLNLDTPLIESLRGFGLRDPQAQAQVTLGHVLSHRTGVPRHDPLWYLTPFSREQLFHRLRYIEPNKNPGAGFGTFAYNNFIYSSVADAAIEMATGNTWEQVVDTRILQPLQMTSTSLTLAKFLSASNRAKGRFARRPPGGGPLTISDLPLKDFANIGPAGEINSNVIDLAKWVVFLLNKGKAEDGTQLVAPERVADLYASRVTANPKEDYGLGWYLSREGKRRVYHGGTADGFVAHVAFMPDEGVGVVVLMNRHQNPAAKMIATDILNHLVSESVAPPPSSGFTPSATVPPPAANGSMQDFVGYYSDPGYGDVTISLVGDDKLRLSYYQMSTILTEHTPVPPGTSRHQFNWEFSAFGARWMPTVTFNRTASGTVDKLIIPLEGNAKPVEFIKR